MDRRNRHKQKEHLRVEETPSKSVTFQKEPEEEDVPGGLDNPAFRKDDADDDSKEYENQNLFQRMKDKKGRPDVPPKKGRRQNSDPNGEQEPELPEKTRRKDQGPPELPHKTKKHQGEDHEKPGLPKKRREKDEEPPGLPEKTKQPNIEKPAVPEKARRQKVKDVGHEDENHAKEVEKTGTSADDVSIEITRDEKLKEKRQLAAEHAANRGGYNESYKAAQDVTLSPEGEEEERHFRKNRRPRPQKEEETPTEDEVERGRPAAAAAVLDKKRGYQQKRSNAPRAGGPRHTPRPLRSKSRFGRTIGTMKKFGIRVFSADMENPEEKTRTDTVAKICKVIASFIIFLLVFGGSLISKATLLFITANMRSNLPLACELQNGTNFTGVKTCLPIPHRDFPLGDCMSSSVNITAVCQAVTVRWIWAGVLTICAPYILTFLRCMWIIIFKGKNCPRWDSMLFAFIIETLYAIGIAMLVFRVLPGLNSLQGAVVALGASTIPASLRAFSFSETKKYVYFVFDIIALLMQLTALIVWPALIGANGDKFFRGDFTQYPGATDRSLAVMIPFSLLLISARYWQNYIDKKTIYHPETIDNLILQLNKDKVVINVFTSLWKCAVTILMMMAFLVKDGRSVQDLFNFNGDRGRCGDTISMADLPPLNLDWVYVWLICFLSGLVVYSATRTAAKILIEKVCYAIPVWISTPVLLGSLAGACETWNRNHCSFGNNVRQWFHCYPPDGGMSVLIQQQHIWIAVLWWISQIWITRHVWHPWSERLAPTDKLLVQPLWDGAVLEQHVLHNRRRINPDTLEKDRKTKEEQEEEEDTKPPFIYLCATMWHEEVQEMTNLIKSILRLDEDQKKKEKQRDIDYYEFEGQIYFDDAFEKDDDGNYVINKYVQQLLKVMKNTKSGGPDGKASGDLKTCKTPYGGYLKWTLPYGNSLVCHLKNKNLIKHKKRWSQVMYMNYIIKFLLRTNQNRDSTVGEIRGDKNTYFLALDGDVDFEPKALLLLVDLMKTDEQLGAACGRIHPKGSGPMVWYQKFEYAIGHWLQKATEHVLGCVLCSPGCFSLFRASSMIEEKDGKDILGIYAGMPEKPLHHLQYDQGEDRWLCTLLLKFGHRVAYCAASDALTFAPEGFGEFYNQRRRWTPSTMANIWDLLQDWHRTVKNNQNVSPPYIVYQFMLFVLSSFGPGTICLMVAGALNSAYPGLTNAGSFALTIIPVIIFIIVCFLLKSSTQILLAQILTLAFGVLQFIVLIGILVQIRTDGLCSPATLFFLFVAGTFILSAILHPQEFLCLIHGLIYFLLIPSMYMLLILYAVINLNVTSWGTREGNKKPEAGQPGKKFRIKRDETGGFSFRLGPLRVRRGGAAQSDSPGGPEAAEQREEGAVSTRRESKKRVDAHDGEADGNDNTNFWMYADELVDAEEEEIKDRERKFFEHLIKKILGPKVMTGGEASQSPEEVAEGLKDFRNKSAITFLLANLVLVVVIFTLQAQGLQGLAIPWTCNGKQRTVEPVGMLFIFSYGIIMIIQLIGMLIHRMGTFLHIVAATSLCNEDVAEGPEEES